MTTKRLPAGVALTVSLLGGAGILQLDVTEVSADQMRRTYEANVFGVVKVTNTLLPSCAAPGEPGSSMSPACSAP
jgi:NAD(P)-dependent dehydrogenase (short-subunit alcohol dehydrogenase family)